MTSAECSDLTDVAQEFAAEPYTYIASNEPYGVGENNPEASRERGAAKREFIAGSTEWPSIADYPLLDRQALSHAEVSYLAQLNTVVGHIERSGDESDEASVLYQQIARKLGEVFRHQKIIRLLGHVAAGEVGLAEEARNHAAIMSEELFGAPEVDMFQQLMAADVRSALSWTNSEDTTRARIADEYITLLGFVRPDESADTEAAAASIEGIATEKSFELTEEAIRIIRSDYFTLYPQLEDALRPFSGRKGNAKPIDAVPVFEAVLRATGLDNWSVRVLMGKKQACETHGTVREITFGEKREDFTPQTLVTRPIHEGIHAGRHKGALSQIQPHLKTELPGTLEFEEGFPSVMEQVMRGEIRVPGEKYYIQLGLLKGMHTAGASREQSFRAAYEIMWRRAALQEQAELDNTVLSKLQASAYSSVMRTARGNARDNRDISYFEGARKATQFLNETARLPVHLRLERLRWVMSGKFDPTNPQHAAMFGGDPAADYLRAA